MLMAEFWSSLRHRWYWVVVGAVLSAALAAGIFVQVGPQYSLVTETVLLPPTSSSPQGKNPYLGLSTLTPTVDVVLSDVRGPKTSERLRASGISAAVAVEGAVGADPSSPAPLIISTVTADTPTDAVRASRFFLAAIPASLANLQSRSNVPDAQRITSTVVVEASAPTLVRKSQIRATIGAAIFGGVLTLLMVGALDALLTGRRGRRRARNRGARTIDTAGTTDTTGLNEISEKDPIEAEVVRAAEEEPAGDEAAQEEAARDEAALLDRARAVVGRR